MQETCWLCHAPLESETETVSRPVLRGVCPQCSRLLSVDAAPMSLSDYLDQLDVPVLVMKDDVRVAGYNEAARALLGGQRGDLVGLLGGDALSCEFARLPGGCGKTEHCKGCAVRHAVTATQETGASMVKIPAYHRRRTPNGTEEVRLLVSTERMGRFVLLRIDEVTPAHQRKETT